MVKAMLGRAKDLLANGTLSTFLRRDAPIVAFAFVYLCWVIIPAANAQRQVLQQIGDNVAEVKSIEAGQRFDFEQMKADHARASREHEMMMAEHKALMEQSQVILSMLRGGKHGGG